jgi:hypothetical protein
MKKNLTIIFVVLITVVFTFLYKIETGKNTYKRTEIKISGVSFNAFISDTETLREKGLSGFSSLKDGEAMLFVFQKPDIYGFWMKDVSFPIDILWLDKDFKVIHMEKNVSPNTYPNSFYPSKPAQYAIEFRANLLDKIDLAEGDSVAIDNI